MKEGYTKLDLANMKERESVLYSRSNNSDASGSKAARLDQNDDKEHDPARISCLPESFKVVDFRRIEALFSVYGAEQFYFEQKWSFYFFSWQCALQHYR